MCALVYISILRRVDRKSEMWMAGRCPREKWQGKKGVGDGSEGETWNWRKMEVRGENGDRGVMEVRGNHWEDGSEGGALRRWRKVEGLRARALPGETKDGREDGRGGERWMEGNRN